MMINLPSILDEINSNNNDKDNSNNHHHNHSALNGHNTNTLSYEGTDLLAAEPGMTQLHGATDPTSSEEGAMVDGENVAIIDVGSHTNGISSSTSSSTPSVVGADAQEELQMMASIIESELHTNTTSNNNINNNNNGAGSTTKQGISGTSGLAAGGNSSMGKPATPSMMMPVNSGSGTGMRSRKQSLPPPSSSSSSQSQSTRLQRSSSYNATPISNNHNNHNNNSSSSNANHRSLPGSGSGGDRERGSDKYTLPLLVGEDGEYLLGGSQQVQGLNMDSPLQNNSMTQFLTSQKSTTTSPQMRIHHSLLGVSRMLAVLKHHVERSLARSRRGPGLGPGLGRESGLAQGPVPGVFSFVRGTAANTVAVERKSAIPRSITIPSSSSSSSGRLPLLLLSPFSHCYCFLFPLLLPMLSPLIRIIISLLFLSSL